jgi:catalase-peroxidase
LVCGPIVNANDSHYKRCARRSIGRGNGVATISSDLEGAWTKNPIQRDNNYLENLFGYEWVLTKSAAGAQQWTPKDASAAGSVPDAHDPSKRHAPMMTTADMSASPGRVYSPSGQERLALTSS